MTSIRKLKAHLKAEVIIGGSPRSPQSVRDIIRGTKLEAKIARVSRKDKAKHGDPLAATLALFTGGGR